MSWLQRLSRRGRADADRVEATASVPRLTREGPDRGVAATGRSAGTGGIFRRPSRGLTIASPERRKGPSAVELPYPAAPPPSAAPMHERRAVPREPRSAPEPEVTAEPEATSPSVAEGFAHPEVDLGLPPLRVIGVVDADEPPAETPPGPSPPVTESAAEDRPEPPRSWAPDPVEEGWTTDPVAPVLADLSPDTGADLWLGGEPGETETVAESSPPEDAGPPVDDLGEPVIVIDAPLDDEPPLHVEGLGERAEPAPSDPEPDDPETARPVATVAAGGDSDELAATLGGEFDDPNLRLAAAAGRPVVAMRRREEAIGSIVDCRVQPVGSLRVEPLALGPYRFPSAASADEFVDETMRALEYLGCDVE